MLRWKSFAEAAPAIAEAGRRLLYRPDQGEVALLATVDGRGNPRIAPVCPIFTPEGIYLSVSARTPKREHLQSHGGYAMHAQVGADDEEFQIGGRARQVTDAGELERVREAIPFPSYGPDDPIFELLIGRALVVTWPADAEGAVKVRWAEGG